MMLAEKIETVRAFAKNYKEVRRDPMTIEIAMVMAGAIGFVVGHLATIYAIVFVPVGG
jgi:hypothetical protein